MQTCSTDTNYCNLKFLCNVFLFLLGTPDCIDTAENITVANVQTRIGKSIFFFKHYMYVYITFKTLFMPFKINYILKIHI